MTLEESLTLMEFPFSKECMGSKVPDGKVAYSIAAHEGQTATKRFENRVSQVILSPNYVSPFSLLSYDVNGVDVVDCFAFSSPSHDLVGMAGDLLHVKPPEAPDRWRLVSAGMRIILTDNSVQNDGWFEAIRLNWGKTELSNNYADVDGFPNHSIIAIDMSLAFAASLALDANWCKEPSYMTGKLRDIDKYMFYLQSMEDRDFVLYRSSWTDVVGGISPSYESLIDKNFDNVVVRFHSGTDLPAGTAVEATSVVINSIHHFEEVYDRGNYLSKFQTSCVDERDEVRKFDRELRSHILPGVECFPDRNVSTLKLHDRE